MEIRDVLREVDRQLDDDHFDNRIILTLSEWNCIKEKLFDIAPTPAQNEVMKWIFGSVKKSENS